MPCRLSRGCPLTVSSLVTAAFVDSAADELLVALPASGDVPKAGLELAGGDEFREEVLHSGVSARALGGASHALLASRFLGKRGTYAVGM